MENGNLQVRPTDSLAFEFLTALYDWNQYY